MTDVKAELRVGLLEIWKRVLKVDTVDPEGDFFSLGGDSLQLVDLVSQVCSRYGVDFDYDRFFENPRIQTMLELLCSSAHNRGKLCE